MALTGCEDDFDCPSNLICFDPSEPWNDEYNVTFCDCMHDEGWTRNDLTESVCTEFTTQAYYYLAVDSFQLLLCALGLLYAIVQIYFYMDVFSRVSVQKVTLVSSMIALIAIATWRSVHIYAILTPTADVISLSGIKKPESTYMQNILIIVVAVSSMFAYLNVSLVWMELLEKLQIFSDSWGNLYMCFEKLPKQLSYRNLVYGVQAFAIVLGVISLIIQNAVLAGVALAFPFILALIMYTRGRYFLGKVFQEAKFKGISKAEAGNLNYTEFARNISRTSLLVVGSLFGIAVGMGLFLIFYSPRNNTSPSGLSVTYIARDFAVFSALLGHWAIISYICFLLRFSSKPQSETPVTREMHESAPNEPTSLGVSI